MWRSPFSSLLVSPLVSSLFSSRSLLVSFFFIGLVSSFSYCLIASTRSHNTNTNTNTNTAHCTPTLLNRAAFLKKFAKAMSVGFDPDLHLKKVGLANQTTMYKRETRAIGKLLEKAMLARYGPKELPERYLEFDTICDATQTRQDAVADLADNKDALGLDFVLVVGGWDSSNTQHLLEIPHNSGLRAFHINRAECISADNVITHRTIDGEIVTEEFLPRQPRINMGLTSGASTPDAAVQDSLERIFMLQSLRGEGEGGNGGGLGGEGGGVGYTITQGVMEPV